MAIEFHYAKNILEGLQYDSIYHEHLFYFTAKTLINLLEKYGLNYYEMIQSKTFDTHYDINKIHNIPGINYNENVESYASIIKNCDLIISIDNMTAHLAARLGKPVWILLSNNSDYKWLEKSENSIWYKNVLLLRQTDKNDWSKIISYINSALK